MKNRTSLVLPTLIISLVLLVIAAGIGGVYLHNQSVQHKAQLAATEQAQQEQEAAAEQQEQSAAQLQAKKAAAKVTLDNCIADVNNQTTQAAAQAATVPTTPEAGAAAEQSILQVQQNFTEQCQATYDATIAQLSSN